MRTPGLLAAGGVLLLAAAGAGLAQDPVEAASATAMTDCHMRFSYPGGRVSESTHAGEVVWRDPVTHSAENLGPGECHVLNIEPKDAAAVKK